MTYNLYYLYIDLNVSSSVTDSGNIILEIV